MMKVTLYTRPDCLECRRVWDMLSQEAVREVFDLQEADSPAGAPAPCVRFDAPGSPFHNAEGLTQAQFASYLEDARRLVRVSDTASAERTKSVKRAGAEPTAQHESAHPIRSFLWRHRVGAIISSLSLFLGTAWVAPLTASWGWGSGIYNGIHSAYRVVCDQIPERSAELGGLPVCLCWRCTAIYGGALLFGMIYTVGRDRKLDWLQWLTRPISLAMLFWYVLPLTLDGASHAFGWRSGIGDAHSQDWLLSWEVFSVDWWLRIGTAALATVGTVKFLCPRLDKLGVVYERLYGERVGKRGMRSPEAVTLENAANL